MATDEPATNGTNWRLRALEHRVLRLEEVKPDVISERVDNHARELASVRDEMASLKRALYTFAFSVAGSGVAFAVTVTQFL